MDSALHACVRRYLPAMRQRQSLRRPPALQSEVPCAGGRAQDQRCLFSACSFTWPGGADTSPSPVVCADKAELKEKGAAECPTLKWQLVQEMSLPRCTPRIEYVSSAWHVLQVPSVIRRS